MTPRPALALLGLLLGACTPIALNRPELALYTLEAAGAPRAGPPVTWQLVVDEPYAAGALAGTRIAVRAEALSYGVLSGARWSERAPRVVQDLLLRGFEDSGRIIGVGRASAGLRGDFQLLLELRRFEADYAGGRDVVVEIVARLTRYASNEALATRRFAARQPIDGRGNAAVVAAFDAAMADLVPEVVDWALTTGEANWQSQNPVPR